MALPRVSKVITAHQKLCEFVEWFVKTYRQELAEALAEVFQQDTEEGQTTPDVLPFVDGLLRRLRSALNDLIEAEKVHLDELADDAGYRKLRDDAVTDVRRVVLDLRGLFRAAFGPIKAQEAGFEKEVASDPVALLRQTNRLLDNLGRDDLDLPPSQYEGVTVTPALFVTQLEPQVKVLREAMNHVVQEEGEAQGTQVAKNRALQAFAETYVLFLHILQAAFRMAGKPELAARLRRTVRRSRRSGDAEPVLPPLPPDIVVDEGDEAGA